MVSHRKMRLIFVLWLLLSSTLSFASPKDIQFATRFEHLSLEDDLSHI
jgi:hypothetical protein